MIIRQRWKAAVVIFFTIMLLISVSAVVVISWMSCTELTHPGTEVSEDKLKDFNLPMEDVRFKTRDGLNLAG
jgi:hypothetical protein